VNAAGSGDRAQKPVSARAGNRGGAEPAFMTQIGLNVNRLPLQRWAHAQIIRRAGWDKLGILPTLSGERSQPATRCGARMVGSRRLHRRPRRLPRLSEEPGGGGRLVTVSTEMPVRSVDKEAPFMTQPADIFLTATTGL
jgi:hypothetical protein